MNGFERKLAAANAKAKRAAEREAAKVAAKVAKEEQKAAAKAARAEAKAAKARQASKVEDTGPMEVFRADPRARWASLDLAKSSGYALWMGTRLVECGSIRPRAKSGHDMPWDKWSRVAFLPNGKSVTFDFDREELAWKSLTWNLVYDNELTVSGTEIKYVVIERAHVRFPGAALDLGERHGRVKNYLGVTRGPLDGPRGFRSTPSQWRQVVEKVNPGFVWPAKADHKAISLTMALKMYGRSLGKADDVADAIHVGGWFVATYLAQVTP